MAKDDYFVLAYRILKYLYECFKAGERADTDMFGPDALGINNGYWVNIIESLYNEGYITGVAFSIAVGAIRSAKVYDARITQKGIEFLEDNSRRVSARSQGNNPWLLTKTKELPKERKRICLSLFFYALGGVCRCRR